MKKHEWRETTDEGQTRFVTAKRHGGKWELQSKLKSDTEWTQYPDILLEDLETLLELMENKYRRNRVPYGHVLELEALIEKAKLRK